MNMAYENEVMGIMENLVIADKHIIASLMTQWTAGTSAVNNSYKALTNLVGLGKLVKGDGYFKLPECKSEWHIHAQHLSRSLVEVLKIKLNTKIFREHTIPVGLRPDAIVLLTKGNKGLCFVLEVCNNEKSDYLCQKINAWRSWDKATEYLSTLFNAKIPCFDIVVAGSAIENTFEFQDYLKEVLHA
jgi:hypothetical protein